MKRLQRARYFLNFCLLLLLSLDVMAENFSQDFHQKANWLGAIEFDNNSKKWLVKVVHDLNGPHPSAICSEGRLFPESQAWFELQTPLQITFFAKNEMKEVVATRYKFELDCNEFPTYEIQAGEDLKGRNWIFAAPHNQAAYWVENNAAFEKSSSIPLEGAIQSCA